MSHNPAGNARLWQGQIRLGERQGREWFFDLVADPQVRHDLGRDPDAATRVSAWRDRLVANLAQRPEDNLVEGGRLVPGRTFQPVKAERPETV